ncbi:MAG TPA: hydroxymethylpyrimidine/phosphomethylpyrimidine kinase [Accumulibacter sp.]|nr:hydroxymethylpyrimidine/phosphomethylpyrimidine kinase [Accumulibacter sp.]HMW16501.1 hydroxymethylpyrimidine/phosphomethylpyrimidine kinase [Accumulibacter sp.]HMX22249.1 hydroxymethylpyrimidine/phosphomethylpyrimidine kinase [Accumulibacter sp.]HMY06876.1 hydroxymethylpyrimidine/phosphomethylpyrimidine kinase [Accumulibacter sp.]HNC16831.1 hydroxymethylpyrimidine/phosphomethylpyrimidine kinase [Accumulibacter sp.]
MNRRCRLASPPLVLVFAASDPSCGAGLQADILTLASMSCHPLTVVTALTAQDSVGVYDIAPVSAEWVVKQAQTLLQDMTVAACKIGLLGGAEQVKSIADLLAALPKMPVIVDPVLASGRGDVMADQALISAIREHLLPLTTVLTPNTLEARRLVAGSAGVPEAAAPTLAECGRQLLDLGCEYVLLTGTHHDTPQVINELYHQGHGRVRADSWPRLPGSYHGSGCTLASAVAAGLAQGYPVEAAVHAAQRYTWETLDAAFRPGKGQFIPDRLFSHRPGNDDE